MRPALPIEHDEDLPVRERLQRRRGFGERVENPEDGRSFLLRLTPKGVSAWRAAGERLGKIVASLDKRLDRPAGEIQDALLALQAAFDSELAASEEPARR